MLETFLARLESRDAVIGIVGLGYVGLPVAVTFAQAGFKVVGIDLDPERIAAIENAESYIHDIDANVLASLRSSGRLTVSTDYASLQEADAVLVSVPTPLAEGVPDLSRVVSAGQALAKVLKPGALVVLESTTYPGTTQELFCPLLEADGRRAGRDFMLAYSPERIDPGNPLFSFADIPKVAGGIDAESTAAVSRLYEQVVPKVVAVSSPKEAELSKLIENTFRHVNIALVNELAVYAHEMDVDIWEAIEAASSKPFGFLPFWPGPGWGGHCIPLDPAYLSWRVRQDRAHEVRFVELAQAVNSEMPRHVVERVSLLLNEISKPINGARILGVGVAYKGGTNDTRESPGMKVLAKLMKRGAKVSFHDPLVDDAVIGGEQMSSLSLDPATLSEQDLVLVLIPQEGVDWDLIRQHAKLVFDACNAFGGVGENVRRL